MPCSAVVAPRDASGSPSAPAIATEAPPRRRLRWPRRTRLLRRADYRAVYECGLRRSSPHFAGFVLARRDSAGPRFGITASGKLGGAVVRNRLRRRTRELLRMGARPEATLAGCDIVLNPRPAVATAPLPVLAEELESLLRRLAAAATSVPG
ncbi:MAG: ribonuclease P protein component [Terriglobales bacterium]